MNEIGNDLLHVVSQAPHRLQSVTRMRSTVRSMSSRRSSDSASGA